MNAAAYNQAPEPVAATQSEPARDKQEPYLEIIEQPKARGLSFKHPVRYVHGRGFSEETLDQQTNWLLRLKRFCAGSIPGENSAPGRNTYPTIKIHNYIGPAVIVVSCVTKEEPYKPHPNNLVGKDCRKGVCTLRVRDTNIVKFPHISIQCTNKKEVDGNLRMRQDINVDPFQTGFMHKGTHIDLNVIRLCFQAFLPDDHGRITRIVPPVVSQLIHNRSNLHGLVIHRVDRTSGKPRGGDEVFLLCDKFNRDDTRVRFYEEVEGNVCWEDFGDIELDDVHRQCAIVFKTPAFREVNLTQPTEVQMQLQRISDLEGSEPITFIYIPEEPDPDRILEKRKRIAARRLLRQEADPDRVPEGRKRKAESLSFLTESDTPVCTANEDPSMDAASSDKKTRPAVATQPKPARDKHYQGLCEEEKEQPMAKGLMLRHEYEGRSANGFPGGNSTPVGKTFLAIKDPYIEIMEQPMARWIRFRHKCESMPTGGIPGENSTRERRTFPTIKIHNYSGPAVIVLSLVTNDEPYKPHPNNLVGKDCMKGVCTLRIRDTNTVSFPHINIVWTKARDVDGNLKMRQEINVDPFQTGFKHIGTKIDPNVVRLCFQVFLQDDRGKISRIVPPVVSQLIYDRRIRNLAICRVNRTSGKLKGGDEVFLLCEKINRDDVRVRFYEEIEGSVQWEAFGDFGPNDVHQQFAIVFKTPAFREVNLTHPIEVQVQLQRISDLEGSDFFTFTYMPHWPEYSENPETILEKRKRKAEHLSFVQEQGSHSTDAEITGAQDDAAAISNEADTGRFAPNLIAEESPMGSLESLVSLESLDLSFESLDGVATMGNAEGDSNEVVVGDAGSQ